MIREETVNSDYIHNKLIDSDKVKYNVTVDRALPLLQTVKLYIKYMWAQGTFLIFLVLLLFAHN